LRIPIIRSLYALVNGKQQFNFRNTLNATEDGTMRFCEKLKDARTKAGMKQEELAKALGVSLRTITNYESGECYPRKRDIYHKLAELFHTEENYFLNEDEEFLLSAAEKYGAKGKTGAGTGG
jgi:DNA-binding XRE family transcriptional regulator